MPTPMGRTTAWKKGLAEHGVNEKGLLLDDGSWIALKDYQCPTCNSRVCMCEDVEDVSIS